MDSTSNHTGADVGAVDGTTKPKKSKAKPVEKCSVSISAIDSDGILLNRKSGEKCTATNYKDKMVVNVLNGIWDPDVLIASMCWEEPTPEEVSDVDLEFCAIVDDNQSDFGDICSQIGSDMRFEDWMRNLQDAEQKIPYTTRDIYSNEGEGLVTQASSGAPGHFEGRTQNVIWKATYFGKDTV
eukprot:COSAG02_NODE_18367_length_943_cov_1.258294_1_plen_183_part_00